MFPAVSPVSKCRPKPMNCAFVRSSNPREIPITAKNVPTGVWETISIIANIPDIAHAAINPAKVQ